jgi:hypothetical protein
MAVSAHRKPWIGAGTGAARGSADNVNTRVSWREIDPSQYAEPRTFVVTGTVEGTSLEARATVTVKEESS